MSVGTTIGRRMEDERGSSIVEFAMISVLLVFLLFAVLQVAAYFYVKSVVAAAAATGARYGANAGTNPAAGGTRASAQIEQGLSAGLAGRIPCVGSQASDAATGLETAQVRCRGSIKSALLPIGALVTIDVSARSLKERR